jgi:DNA-binding NarL/FixJ family response regulator
VIQNLFDEMDGPPTNGDGQHRPEASLTQRETDIMSLLAEGKSNREISRSLFLSEKTVKAHLAAIFRKLGVTNRTQAAMAAVSMGIGPNPRSPEGGGEPSETHAVGR